MIKTLARECQPADLIAAGGQEMRIAWFQGNTVAAFPAQDAGPKPHNLRYFSVDAIVAKIT